MAEPKSLKDLWAEDDARKAADPEPADTRAVNVPRFPSTTLALDEAGRAHGNAVYRAELEAGRTEDEAREAQRRAEETVRVLGEKADTDAVRRRLAAETDSEADLTRALGQRVVPAPFVAPSVAEKDAEAKRYERGFRATDAPEDVTGIVKGAEVKPVEIPQSQRKEWIENARKRASESLGITIATGGLYPLLSGDWWETAKGFASDPDVQKGVFVLHAGTGNVAHDVIARSGLGATVGAVAAPFDEGEIALFWDDGRPREDFDKAADAFYTTGDRSGVDALPVRSLPARLRGTVIDVDRFLRSAEADPDPALDPIRAAADRGPEYIESVIERLPVAVAARYQPDLRPDNDELTGAYHARHNAKERGGDYSWMTNLATAGLFKPLDDGKTGMYVPSAFQEVLRYAGIPWAATMVEPDVNPLTLMAAPLRAFTLPIEAATGTDLDALTETAPGDTSIWAKMKATRIPTIYGTESMIQSGAFNDWLNAIGLSGGEDFAELYDPDSTYWSRLATDAVLPDYAQRGWEGAFVRAGGDPQGGVAQSLGSLDLAAQFAVPVEDLFVAPLGMAARAGSRAIGANRALRELGIPAAQRMGAVADVAVPPVGVTDPLAAMGNAIGRDVRTLWESGRLDPESMSPTARKQLASVLGMAGVQDAETTTAAILDYLRDRRASIYDTAGEMAAVGGPQTRALRESDPYKRVRAEIDALPNLPPAERDVLMRTEEVRALNAWDHGEIDTPEEWFARQMWREGVEGEELPGGTMYAERERTGMGASDRPRGLGGMGQAELDARLLSEHQQKLHDDFTNNSREYGVESSTYDAAGLWAGAPENAVIAASEGSVDGAREAAGAWALRRKQDAVALFRGVGDAETATHLFFEAKLPPRVSASDAAMLLDRNGVEAGTAVAQAVGSRLFIAANDEQIAAVQRALDELKGLGASIGSEAREGVLEIIAYEAAPDILRAGRSGLTTSEERIAALINEGIEHDRLYRQAARDREAALAAGGSRGEDPAAPAKRDVGRALRPAPDQPVIDTIFGEGQGVRRLQSADGSTIHGSISPEPSTTAQAPNPAREPWEAESHAAAQKVRDLEAAEPPSPEWQAWKAEQDRRANLAQQRDALQRNPRHEDPEWDADLGTVLEEIAEMGEPKPEPPRVTNPSPELAAARADLDRLRKAPVPRTIPKTSWLIRLFATGDFWTAIHEGAHYMALVRPGFERELARVFDSTGGRLTVKGHEQFAEAVPRMLRGRLPVDSRAGRLVREFLDALGDVWWRIRDLPIVEKLPDRMRTAGDALPKPIPVEFARIWDKHLKPGSRMLPPAVRIVDERGGRLFPAKVTVAGDLAEEVAEGKVAKAGRARYATSVERNPAEVRAALGLKAGEQVVDPVDLMANAMAYIGVERLKKQWGVADLESLPSGRTAVPRARKAAILRDADRRVRAALGRLPEQVPGENVLRFDADQQAGLRRLIREVEESPIGETLPESLRDGADLGAVSVEDWNALQAHYIDLRAGHGAWREKAAERAQVAGLTRLFGHVVAGVDETDARIVTDTARKMFVSSFGGAEEYLQPAQKEMVQAFLRDLAASDGEIRRAAFEMGRAWRAGKGDFRAVELVQELAKSVPPEVVPVDSLDLLTDLRRLGEAPTLEQVAERVDDLHRLFTDAPLDRAASAQTAAEVEALAHLDRVARSGDVEALMDPATDDAMAIVLEGLRRRSEAVESAGMDITLTFAGSKDATAIDALKDPVRRWALLHDNYARWYAGEQEEIFQQTAAMGRAAAGQTYDQGDAILATLLRLNVRRKFGQFARRMAESGLVGDVAKMAQGGLDYRRPYTLGGYAQGRDAWIDDVADYIAADSGWLTQGLVRDGVPVEALGTTTRAGRLDPTAYAEAVRQRARWGFSPGPGVTDWVQADLPGGAKVLMPKVFQDAFQKAIDEAAPYNMAFGDRLSWEPRIGELTPGASAAGAPPLHVEAINTAVRAIYSAGTYSFGMLKKGMLTGIGPLIRPAYFVGNTFGGFFQLYQTVGLVDAVSIAARPLMPTGEGKLVRSVIGRMYADGTGFWGGKGIDFRPTAGFFARDGRYLTDQMVAEGAVRSGLNSSLAKQEFGKSLIADIVAQEPLTWRRMMGEAKGGAASGVVTGAAVGGLAAGPVGAAKGAVLGGVAGAAAGAIGATPLAKAWDRLLTEGATAIDNYYRVALYVDGLKKGMAAEEAAGRARLATFDYNDLTDFERNVARKAVLFYAFQRRNQDLFWWTLANHPARIMGQLRLMRGLQERAIEDDAELYISEYDEKRMALWFRDPLRHGHLENAQQGAMTFTPGVPVADQVGLWLDVFGTMHGDREAIGDVLGRLNPWISTAAMVAPGGIDIETGRAVDQTRQKVPNVVVEADYAISSLLVDLDDEINGGLLTREVFRARPVAPWDDAEQEHPGAPVYEIDRTDPWAVRAWIVFNNLTGAGPSARTATQMRRIATPRVGVTVGEELGTYLGIPTKPVERREVAIGRLVQQRTREQEAKAREEQQRSITSRREQ